MKTTLSRAQAPLRDFVNTSLQGRQPYEVTRLVVILGVVLRILRGLQHIAGREGLRKYLLSVALPLVKRLPPVKKQIETEMQKITESTGQQFAEEVSSPCCQLPERGMAEKDILALIEQREQLDTKHWKAGKVTGAIYHGEQAHYDFIGSIYAKWAFTNPLHPAIHPALRQMDSEVIRMVVNMYSGDEKCCGAFTTGGTESILMAMKTYRDWGRATKGVTEPNIVVCQTAHAAFWKAGQYFNIFVKEARANDCQEVDLRHMASLIDSNTVAIVGSCCQYAHGTVDPIQKMAKIALQKNIGLHVDCCLGGFLVPFMTKAGFELPPFDFRVPGVTSISCDPHKYGFAPKGSSVVMFSSEDLRRHMYCMVVDWTGGIYATPTLCGSRPGGVVAATWASMVKHGESGYIETTKQIVGACRKVAQGIREMDGVQLVGRPDVCCVAFDCSKESGMNCYAVADCMKQKFGWELGACQRPPCIHLAFTLPNSKNADLFLQDLQQTLEMVKADKSDTFTKTAGVYGMAGSLPTSFIEPAAAAFLDAMTLSEFGKSKL